MSADWLVMIAAHLIHAASVQRVPEGAPAEKMGLRGGLTRAAIADRTLIASAAT